VAAAPAPAPAPVVVAAPATPVTSTPAPSIESSPAAPPPIAVTPVAPPPARPTGETAAPPPVAPETAALPPPPPEDPPPPPRSGRAFAWPVRGNVISGFGSKPGGLQNDGINIAAARGAPVRAADAGVVVYAGNELKGFGNLLLLRHADGWMTAYAHLDEIGVERGQQVQRGQVVARVGQSGGVTSPQLHFEVRRGTRPVDPKDHLQPVISAAMR
jgi:murein DD-endopeptidase MepM/ murein hydrolase activator NlpD